MTSLILSSLPATATAARKVKQLRSLKMAETMEEFTLIDAENNEEYKIFISPTDAVRARNGKFTTFIVYVHLF